MPFHLFALICDHRSDRTLCDKPYNPFPPGKVRFIRMVEDPSRPQKRTRWPPKQADGVLAELAERGPAARTCSASGHPEAPVRRAPCCVPMSPPPFCTHMYRQLPAPHELRVGRSVSWGGGAARNLTNAHLTEELWGNFISRAILTLLPACASGLEKLAPTLEPRFCQGRERGRARTQPRYASPPPVP